MKFEINKECIETVSPYNIELLLICFEGTSLKENIIYVA